MTTIVVSSAIANKPGNGGNAWAVLNWVLGLRRLGCRVFFLEQIGRSSCIDASGAVVPFEASVNLAFFARTVARFGLAGDAALIYEGGEQVHGATMEGLLDLAGTADALINITGHLALGPLLRRLRRKVYVDFDPCYTQFWHAAGDRGPRLAGHDCFFTIGENIGTSSCSIPADGIRWRHTRQPVVLEYCPAADPGAFDRFTTVASWRGAYGPVRHGGKTYGLKAHEFRKVFDLPARARQPFEIALDIHPGDGRDLTALREHGWCIVDPQAVAADADAFDRYVRGSGAEFSVAQGMYVDTGSGWFSDRTARYLASGRPALVQDTGFSRNYPVGAGLLSFRTPDEAALGAASIARDYEMHRRAARALAEEFFDSDKVLRELLEAIDLAP